jgi:HAD superfamily hydrolase (TIGR01509 family)
MKTILVDAINTFVTKEGVSQEMYELLEKYPTKKVLLTGADDERMKEYGLDSAPYDVFTLRHDPDKENPAYYQKMLDHFGLRADDVLYFEHREVAVKSAESIGITTYHYDSEKKDLAALKKFLDEHM